MHMADYLKRGLCLMIGLIVSFGFYIGTVKSQSPIQSGLDSSTFNLTDINQAYDYCVGTPSTLSAGSGVIHTDQIVECIAKQMKAEREESMKQIRALVQKRQREEFWDTLKDKFKENIAGAFKSMLRQFSRQLAYDTATWIASGGKGQQPLFITEGIGAYLKNTVDEALGTFIDELGLSFGLDLCEPDFNIKAGILLGINWEKRPEARCSFSEMASNWQSAISDPTFAFEYRTALRPGENDISAFLRIQSRMFQRIDEKMLERILEAQIGDGWKDVKDFAGNILTPGTMIRKQWEKSLDDASKAEEIFTATIWDFIETFLNTLVGKLLQNLMSGFFSGSSGSRYQMPSIYDPLAAPFTGSQRAAEIRFLNLIEGQFKIGGPYDILNRLVNCPPAAITNPGPTDCVIDQLLSQEIRNKNLVGQLPDSIKNRRFAPPVGQDINPQTEFSLRNIIILRKYRIVPIGWELAARTIIEKNLSGYTLGDLLTCFNGSDPRAASAMRAGLEANWCQNMVDPNWVLKAAELFCRREGYGPQNIFAGEQDASINRANYCADEQQCIKEDASGNCLAYGYCTEEKQAWNFNATSCDPRFNTCESFRTRAGNTVSYLANSLDYGNCSANNVGCRWYSALLNPVNNDWRHAGVGSTGGSVYQLANVNQTITVGAGNNWLVPQWRSVSGNNQVIMSRPCTQTGGCSFVGKSCTIMAGGFKCRLDTCLADENLLAGLNPGFEIRGVADWDATHWLEGYQTINNRHSRVTGQGRNNSAALESYTLNNSAPLVTELRSIQVSPNQKYSLRFFARGQINQGSIAIEIYGDDVVLGGLNPALNAGNIGSGWRDYIFEFENQNYNNLTLKIIVRSGTNGRVYFDDFDLKQVNENCVNETVWLTRGVTAAPAASVMYFDRDVGACPSNDVGCSQFIRIKVGLGSNLLPNSGFELGDGGRGAAGWRPTYSVNNPNYSYERVSAEGDNIVRSGNYSIKLSSSGSGNGYAYSLNFFNPSDQNNLKLIKGRRYILSGWVYLRNSEGFAYIDLGDIMGGQDNSNFATKNLQETWQKLERIIIPDQDYYFNDRPRLIISENFLGDAWFDDIQLEEVFYNINEPSNYSAYNPAERPTTQLAYLKQAPAYYNCGTSQASPECANYAAACQPDEVGCELYRPKNNDPAVPGIISQNDICPAECVGYQVYKQEATIFTAAKYVQFIANNTPRYCSAAYAGCDQFTNLDEVARGGEGLEYYSALKVCQKPGAADEATYYTWEGSGTTGYQLKMFRLKKTDRANSHAPCTKVMYDANGVARCADDDPSGANALGVCQKEDLKTNLDCREFYDTAGNIYYRLLSRTVTVSDNCHPYRRTQTQDNITEARNDCQISGGYWNPNDECIYLAIPGEGRICPAAFAGCREYTGNRGNNVRNIFFDDFESGADRWEGGVISTESASVGGHSLTNIKTNLLTVPVQINQNRAYLLSFWAKTNTDESTTNDIYLISIKFTNASQENNFLYDRNSSVISEINLSDKVGEWQKFDFGPVFMTDSVGEDVKLEIMIDVDVEGSIYLDNVLLKEVQQNIYLVENSWFTPLSCDNPLTDPNNPDRTRPGEMLGCQAYTDRAGQTWNLKSFERLCRFEAVGCEALINTYNSNSPFNEVYNAGDQSQVTVSSDRLIYLVNDQRFSCAAENKGCTAYGLPRITKFDEVVGYNTVYLKNQPDRYRTDLCKFDELWCEEFVGSRATAYFKDPRDKLCEFRRLEGGLESNWYKVGTNERCVTSLWPTLGPGGDPEGKRQPVSNNESGYLGWVGLCPAGQSTCTEYIDPLSVIYNNLVFNGDFSRVTENIPDGWTDVSGFLPKDSDQPASVQRATQQIKLNSHTTYTLSAKAVSLGGAFNTNSGVNYYIGINCPANISSPDVSMPAGTNRPAGRLFGEGGNTNIYQVGDYISGRFYLNADSQQVNCQIEIRGDNGDRFTDIKLVKTGVYYQLASSVNRTACNGLVDINNGCVLFNERNAINYANPIGHQRETEYLTFDADKTYQQNISQQQAISPQGNTFWKQRNTNSLIKVQPDRQCASWLYCTTYEKGDPKDTSDRFGNNDRCLDLGLCIAMDASGNCTSFASFEDEKTPLKYTSADAYKTGYSIGIENYYPVHQMEQEGEAANVPNGNFEIVDRNNPTKPLGWLVLKNNEYEEWQDYKFKVATEHNNRLEGLGYLELNSVYQAESEFIDVYGGADYVVSGWINTLDLFPAPNAIAEILIKEFTHDGAPVPINETSCWSATGCSSPSQLDNWQVWNQLTLKSGLSWQQKIQTITTASNTGRIKIKLINYLPPGVGELSGRSLFDDIQLKPVLKAAGDVFISRDCRLYPEQDSRSCKYLRNNNLFYGWYGYCLSRDPKNPGICLQWWPVDLLRGEVMDEVSGYRDRVPLYYCLGESEINNKYNLIPSGYLYVSVQSRKFESGVKIMNCEFMGAIEANNKEDYNLLLLSDDKKIKLPHNRRKWSVVHCKVTEDLKNNGVDNLPLHEDIINNIEVGAGKGSRLVFGRKCPIQVRDWYEFGYATLFKDEVKVNYKTDNPLEIYYNGIWANVTSNNSDWLIHNNLSEYCSQGAHAVFDQKKHLDELWFWFADTSSKFTDDHHWFITVDLSLKNRYCTVLAETVTPMGINKAWTARVSSGEYKINCIGLEPTDCFYDTDYQPYGSAVISDISSFTGEKRLFWRLPNTKLAAPYQERAGQFHFKDFLRKIFAQSYNIFIWEEKSVSFCDFGNAQCLLDRKSCDSDNDCKKDFGLCNVELFTCSEGDSAGLFCGNIDHGFCLDGSVCVDNKCEDGSYCGIVDYGDCGAGSYCTTPVKTCSEASMVICEDDSDCQNITNNYCLGYCSDNSLKRCRDNNECSNDGGFEVSVTGQWGWSPPDEKCVNNIRPLYDPNNPNADYCGVAPVIDNIKINNQAGAVVLAGDNKVAVLEFNVRVDENQLPLTSYRVDWGDGTTISVSGINLRARAHEENNFKVYHYYDYWQALKSGKASCSNNSCNVEVKIHVRDNWGWCNGAAQEPPIGYYSGATGSALNCDTNRILNPAWTIFSGTVTVRP